MTFSDVFSLNEPSLPLFVVSMVGLWATVLGDHLQTLAKLDGVVKKRVAGGYSLAMKVFVINRAGSVIYFMLISFNIDKGISPSTLLIGMSVAIFSLILPTVLFMVWMKRRVNQLSPSWRMLDARLWPRALLFLTFLATTLNLLGLTIPWVAGATFPEFRLTLANTSFLFNTTFTIITVFYIEHHFARLVDDKSERIYGFVAGLMVARVGAFALVGFGLGLWAV